MSQKPVIKNSEECLKEVLEFFPDAKLISDGHNGVPIQVQALNGKIIFTAPFEVGPRKDVNPWWCRFDVLIETNNKLAPIDDGIRFKLEEHFGQTAWDSFNRMRANLSNRLQTIRVSFDEIFEVEKLSMLQKVNEITTVTSTEIIK